MKTKGRVYKLTNDSDRKYIWGYHRKPSPLFYNVTDGTDDIKGLKLKERQKAILVKPMTIESKYTIGVEVEKVELSGRNGRYIKEHALFCGYEVDGSCGYEAVSHILPLLPSGSWRTKIYDLMHQASPIIEDSASPSNHSCGGHMTIGVDGMSGKQINELTRVNCGILLALFRHRLNNTYCGSNRRMQEEGLPKYNSYSNAYSGGMLIYGANDWHHKYQTALVKGKLLEFRLVARFQSVKQMMRRYELMHELVDFSINNPNGSHDAFLNRIKPIILSMYDYNEDKVEQIYALARHFRKFILSGKISQEIAQYLS